MLLERTELRWQLRRRGAENVLDCTAHEIAHKIGLLLQVDDGGQGHVDEDAVALLASGGVLEREVVYVVAKEPTSVRAYFDLPVPFFMQSGGYCPKWQRRCDE